MCGAVALAPLALAATSLFSGGKSGGTQSYTPQEVDLSANNPTPETPEPTLGVDNNASNSAQAKKGKSALVIQRNPSVGVSGSSTGSGVSVIGG